ncbi:MAG TPA: VOC family protein [Thermoanaerobaculia bacterium]|jgi:methylmalonyl-CoA/ethylmalonyl-CoA epimerase|nr:VOC family protein [Thermoanaerobaculia bacterium]
MQIGQIAINAKDVARATAFYRDVLGLKLLFQAGPKLSFFDCGGVRLMVTTAEEAEFDHPASILYYKVDDIRASYEAIKGRGAEFRDEPHLVAKMPDHELWITSFWDTEGNTLALMSEVR